MQPALKRMVQAGNFIPAPKIGLQLKVIYGRYALWRPQTTPETQTQNSNGKQAHKPFLNN
jgi:hypothetical protein